MVSCAACSLICVIDGLQGCKQTLLIVTLYIGNITILYKSWYRKCFIVFSLLFVSLNTGRHSGTRPGQQNICCYWRLWKPRYCQDLKHFPWWQRWKWLNGSLGSEGLGRTSVPVCRSYGSYGPFDTLLNLVTQKGDKLKSPKHPQWPNVLDFFLCETVYQNYGKVSDPHAPSYFHLKIHNFV